MPSTTPDDEESRRRDGIAGAFLAFAAMMKQDYNIGKNAALLALEAAYNVNEDRRGK